MKIEDRIRLDTESALMRKYQEGLVEGLREARSNLESVTVLEARAACVESIRLCIKRNGGLPDDLEAKLRLPSAKARPWFYFRLFRRDARL